MTTKENIILHTGINGGKSVIAFTRSEFNTLEIGRDKKIRVVYKNNERSYPIIEILKAPEDILQLHNELKEITGI